MPMLLLELNWETALPIGCNELLGQQVLRATHNDLRSLNPDCRMLFPLREMYSWLRQAGS
jgi:hypothetical protein